MVACRGGEQALDQHTDDAQIAMTDRDDRWRRGSGSVEVERVGEEIAGEGAQHVDVAMREVDQAQDPVDHRVAERDEGVDRAERQPVDELLENGVHASRD